MKELLFLLAELLPFDELVNQLEDSINKYKIDPSDENKKHVMFNCMLMSAKDATEMVGGVEEMMKQSNLMEQGLNLLKPSKG